MSINFLDQGQKSQSQFFDFCFYSKSFINTKDKDLIIEDIDLKKSLRCQIVSGCSAESRIGIWWNQFTDLTVQLRVGPKSG